MMFKFIDTNFERNTEKNLNIFITNNIKFINKLIFNINVDLSEIFFCNLNNKILNVSKECTFISDPFSLNFNDKKILNALYENEEKNFNTSDKESLLKINSEIVEFIERIKTNSFSDLEYDELINGKSLFSLVKLKFASKNENFFEYFYHYVENYIILFNIKVFITYNFLNFFDDNEINLLIELLKRYEVFIIDIVYDYNLLEKNVFDEKINIFRLDLMYTEY